jgi:putative ABC transport system permease protein
MGVLRFKIIRDLWENKSRTIQVMLIIGIGAAAIGMILTTRNLVVPGMQDNWRRFHAPMLTLYIYPSVDEKELLELEQEKNVSLIEGLSSSIIEWRVNPTDEWKAGGLVARNDYEDMKLDKLELIEGEWPHDQVMLLGQGDDQYFKIPKYGKIFLRVNDKVFDAWTGGTLYNQFQQPAYFGGTAQFYTTKDEYERLVGDMKFDQVLVRGDFPYEEEKATELGNRLTNRIEKMDKNASFWATDPDEHFFQDTMDGLFFLLGVMAVLILALGLLLVYNTINSIISSQVDQIGIMKAVGARTWQVVRLYLTLVLVYGLLSWVFSLPLGIWAGWSISDWLVNSFGATPGNFQMNLQAVIVQSIIALFAPLLSALIPIWNASRSTVREAISTYGLNINTGLIEKIFAHAHRLSRMVIVIISNTFRHKGRVALLQIALVISGLVFMMVVSVRDSVVFTVRDTIFSILNANITLLFEDPERIDYIENLTREVTGIKAVEMWGFSSGTIRPKEQEASDDDDQISLMGVPLPTRVYGYQLRSGRWLNPDDTYAMVLNKKFAEDIGVKVGDWVTIKYSNKKERDWQIVGLTFDPILIQAANVPRVPLLRDLGEVDRGQAIWIQTDKEDLITEQTIAKNLREFYKKRGIKVSPQRGIFGIGGDSTIETANTFINQFNFLVILLAIMALLIGTVGSIALSGALSLSVLERKREIGVMRAVGAPSWTIFRLFIGEGLILGWLSWLIALPLTPYASQLMVYALGKAFQLDILYKYSPAGQIMWLIIITFLSIIASWLPARGATKISVRESLAYQ